MKQKQGLNSKQAVKLGDYIQYFRFNESGDFFSQSCVSKLNRIADYLKSTWNIETYGYTARRDLNFSKATFKVKGSGHDNGNNGKTIVVMTDKDIPKGFVKCPGSCGQCTLCQTPKNIAFVVHGSGRNKPEKSHMKANKKYRKLGSVKMSLGNGKLDDTIMIFNMGNAMACPSKNLGMCACSDVCYARNAERQYPSVRAYRKAQKVYWLTHSASEIIADLETTLNTKKYV